MHDAPLTSQQILDLLLEGECHVNFTKADGSTRNMRATLEPSLLPARNATSHTRTHNAEVFSVWDLDKQSWRSFRRDRLLSITR